MKLLLSGLALLAGIAAQAQPNRISVGMNDFSRQSLTIGSQGLNSRARTENTRVLPSIGYYRNLTKSLGLGLELGWGTVDQTIGTDETNLIGGAYYRETRIRYDAYYICPTVFETFSSANGKYRFVASLSVPIRYSPELKEETFTESQDFSWRFRSYTYEPSGTLLDLGLFVSGSLQRRIAGGLFLCPQIGIGGVYERRKRDGVQVVTTENFGLAPTSSESNIEVSESTYRFEIRPAIALNYYF